jgi:hypothetical protein
MAVGGACRISQMASAKSAVVPLWKVIVGPQPANCSRARKGPAFSLAIDDDARKVAASFALWMAAAMLSGAFAASLAAVEGGQLRDGTWNDRVLIPRPL